MSDQSTHSDHVKRYGPVPTSVHPERQSRLSIWLWVGAAVIGFAMALPDTVFGDTNDVFEPVPGPVSDFGALPVNAPTDLNDTLGRSGTNVTPGIASVGRTVDFPDVGGSDSSADGAAAGPAAPDGWDRPEPGAHAGPESIGGPSQP